MKLAPTQATTRVARRSQGLGCSPIKVARELGSEHRETVRSLSVVGIGSLKGADPITRGPGWANRWRTVVTSLA